MAIIYLTEDDLTPAQTRRVLDALNTVSDAESLARLVEIPDELDIGISLAQRILNYRQQLGGAFENLKQVMDVPLIGPERFTEIVTTLGNVSLPKLYPPQSVELSDFQFERLMQRVKSANKQYIIEARLLNKHAFIGQVREVIIKILDPDTREGRAKLPVTFETLGGTIAVSYGFKNTYGDVVTAVTGADGSIRLRITRDSLEQLIQPQKQALEQALKRWDVNANSPDEITQRFDELINDYEHERNSDLRKAVDIFYQDRENKIVNGINKRNYLYQWFFESVLLRIYITSEENPSDKTVQQSAIQELHWKNWIAPWFQYYRDTIIRRSQLQNRYRVLRDSNSGTFTLVNNILGESQAFVAKQRGLIAEKIAQEEAGNAMQRFLAQDVVALSTDAKRTLFPNLQVAATQIKSSGQGTIGLVSQTRADIEKVVEESVSSPVLDPELSAQIDTVKTQLTAFDNDYATFNSNVSSFNNDFSRFSSDISRFNSDISTFNSDISTFNGNITSFNNNFSTFNSNLTIFNSDLSGFNSNISTFNSDLVGFNSNLASFNSNILNFNNDFASFNSDLSNFNSDILTVNNQLGTFNTNFSTFSTNYSSFNSNYNNFTAGLNEFNTSKTSINTELQNIRSDLNTANSDIVNLKNNRISASGSPTVTSGTVDLGHSHTTGPIMFDPNKPRGG